MGALQTLETQLNDITTKQLPQLPANGRRALAGALWWIALVVGLLQLWAAWALWHLGHLVNRIVDYSNALANIYGVPQTVATPHLGIAYYLAELALVASAVILLLAVSGLKSMNKSGWNWVYYGALLNLVYGVIRVFSGVNGGVGGLLSALVGSAIGLYLLFEVREYFMGTRVAESPAPEEPTVEAHAHTTAPAHHTADAKKKSAKK